MNIAKPEWPIDWTGRLDTAGLDALVESLSTPLTNMDAVFYHNSIFQQPNIYIEGTFLENLDIDAIQRQKYFNDISNDIVSKGTFIEPIKERFKQDAKNANVALNKKRKEANRKDNPLPKEESDKKVATIESYVASEQNLFKAVNDRPQYKPEHQEFYSSITNLVKAVSDGLKLYRGSTKPFAQINAEIELVASILYHSLTTQQKGQQKEKIALATADESIAALMWDIYLMASNFGNGKKSKIAEKVGSSEIYVFSYEKGRFIEHSTSLDLASERIINLHQERIKILKAEKELYKKIGNLVDTVDTQYENLFDVISQVNITEPTEKTAKPKKYADVVLDYLRQHPTETIDAKRAVEITGSKSLKSLNVLLGKMVTEGSIVRPSRGVYGLAQDTDGKGIGEAGMVELMEKPPHIAKDNLSEILDRATGNSRIEFYRKLLSSNLAPIDEARIGEPQYLMETSEDFRNAASIAGLLGDHELESAIAQYLDGIQQKVIRRIGELAEIDLRYRTTEGIESQSEADIAQSEQQSQIHNPYRKGSLPHQIIEHLQQNPGSHLTPNEVVNLFGNTIATARKTLLDMCSKGELERIRRGEYRRA